MDFNERVIAELGHPLHAKAIDLLQVNIGYRCNMACRHCHVSAGPERNEMMDRDTVEAVLGVVRKFRIPAIDITGGAPELNPHFRYFVREAKESGVHVIARTNLSIFFERGMEDLAEFYSAHSVEIIASLPCYTETNVNGVRGPGAFEKSIAAVRSLNALGYSDGSRKRKINFVYNPSGPFIAPDQRKLETDYKRELGGRFGISFDSLYVFNNMPLGRFRDELLRSGSLHEYSRTLESSFNPLTLGGLMCRSLVSVGWDGRLYDCDFNQILGMELDKTSPRHISAFDPERLSGRVIKVSDYCYACTAGQGST